MYDSEWLSDRTINELRKYRIGIYSIYIATTRSWKREQLVSILNDCRYWLNKKTGKTQY
jgi:hypothetical protein